MEIPSQQCASLLFNDRMMDTISNSEIETSSILLLTLYSNGGNVLLLLIGVYLSAKKVLNKVFVQPILVTRISCTIRVYFMLTTFLPFSSSCFKVVYHVYMVILIYKKIKQIAVDALRS